MAKFFIDRPVFASVLSIIIVLAGLASLYTMPVELFPEITPPTVELVASYPGANAETVSASLAVPIEQELSGVEDLIYFQSQSANDGTLRITLTFEIGTDLDIAAVNVQNRLKRAEPRLPQETIRQGITITKRTNNFLMVAALNSENPQFDDLYLSNYATVYMLDALKRVPGVGDVQIFGAKDYSMRVWVNPETLAAKGLSVSEVAAAIREQNGLYAGGRIGAAPVKDAVEFTIPVVARGRFEKVEEFENILLRAEPDGAQLRLKDVARIELGSLSYDSFGRLNGKPTTFIIAFLQPGANALSAKLGFVKVLDELSQAFPEGMRLDTPYDTTEFIQVSIQEVAKTFLEAMVLVMAVVFIFLGNWRMTIIPLLAIPVAIIGTFTGMLVLGFSVNSLTLFGLVLAIGIVVDDAIVVVENVERIMEEEKLPVREATIKAMSQVTGPIIAIVLVLSAVFLPVAFLGGLTGVMYRQFAVTIAISVFISGIVALTLSPALCRVFLRPAHGKKFIAFRAFDVVFNKFTNVYTGMVRLAIRFGAVALLLFGGLLYATSYLFNLVPSGFIPQEDQGYFLTATMLPQGASLERTSKMMAEIEEFLLAQPEVRNVVTLGGQDFLAGQTASTSAGAMFVVLKDWSERPGKDQSVDAVVMRTIQHFAASKDALVLAFNPPAVQGLGFRAGFEMQLQNRSGADVRELAEVTNNFLAALSQEPTLFGVSGVLNVGQPQIKVDLDVERAKALGIPVNTVYETLQAYLGALYVNDFNKFGRIYRVQMQAEPEFRSKPEDIQKILVRNDAGEMVELAGVLGTEFGSGPNVVSRFNSYPSVQITGSPIEGRSTGQAMETVAAKAKELLPQGYAYEWSGASFQEIRAGGQAPYIMLFGLVVVFLVLAAQYEKWSLPFAVLLAVPFAVFGAVLAVYFRGIQRDIYFQIGLLTLIGLAAKNAILIVEFCSAERQRGKGIVEAAVEAARLRLRPIIMTSLAFILGVLPLALSTGAGAAGRHSIGTGVMGGMISATFLAIFFVPLFFVIIQKISEWRWRKPKAPEASHATAQE